MPLGTPVPSAGRGHMQPPAPAAVAAFLGLAWAATTHERCLQAAGAERRALLGLAPRPEASDAWLQPLRPHCHGPPVAGWLALTPGPLVSALRHADCLGRLPVPPFPLAQSRATFPPSRAQDAPSDAALQGARLL